jgi:hypothetical protein
MNSTDNSDTATATGRRPNGANGADPIDPFDPANLTLRQDFNETIGVKKALIRVPVRKPNKQDFIRVRPEPEYRIDTMVLEVKEDREYFLVAPALHAELMGEAVPMTLFTAIDRTGSPFLLPVKITTDATRRGNHWPDSLRACCELGMKSWVRIVADMAAGGYQAMVASANLPDPEWPEASLHALLKLAFGSNMIDRPDHDVVLRLTGRL